MMANRQDLESSEFEALKKLSARVGADPLLVQAAGGNTSLKENGILWIKASGTWLMNAERDDIFVPVRMAPLLQAVADIDPAAEKAEAFTVAELNPGGLRPSIETTVHALMPQRVVVHVHCVETISLAVQANAEAVIGERLRGLDWVFVPYCRPGLPLARAIAERRGPATDILVLGNHGLVVAAETVTEAETLLGRVCGLLARTPRKAPAADTDALLRLAAGSDYRLPAQPEAHAAATDLTNCRMAAAGTLYPDHVIFLGEGSAIAAPGDTAATVVAKAVTEGRPAPVEILFPGKGVLMRRDTNAGAEALARCLADVTARIDGQAALRYLTAQDAHQLMNWDAEKYRQELTRRMGAALQ
jgi:rhamnose utilization protein RhaD (predicted bifunctional aldolase and dehydrogenase)